MTVSEAAARGRASIELRDIRKEFPIASGIEVAVDGIDIDIAEEEFLTLVGPSGCGKTTTLRCVAGLETPTSGSILINGVEMSDVPANERNLAMMFQNIALYPHMSVIDNIAYPLKVRGIPKSDRHARAREAAAVMQIEAMLEKYPGDLSGGQRQRAALARTIVQEPEAFLMDEPLSDLDAKLKTEIRKEIQRVHKRVKKPTIYVTHDQEEAMTMSDRIAVMNDGGIEQIGTPEEVYRYPVNQFVGAFIGNPTMNFMKGSIESIADDAARIVLEGTTIDLRLDGIRNRPSNSEVIVGVRPDHTLIGSDVEGDVTGEIQLLERTGENMLATLNGPQGELQATVPADHDLSEEQVVEIRFDRSRVHLFDQATSDTIGFSV